MAQILVIAAHPQLEHSRATRSLMDGCALAGKDLWLAASTGGPQESYRPDGHNRYFFDAFLHPCEQTAALFAQRLSSWPQWPEIAQMEPAPRCDVPVDARPRTNAKSSA